MNTREVEFIPLDWIDRAAWWPGLQVFSHPVRIPIDIGDSLRYTTDMNAIECLIREALK